MNRRECMAGMGAIALLSTARASAHGAPATLAPLLPSWTAWKAAYLQPDGRIVDAFSEGASHSESQGYGLYLSVLFDDAEAFRAIYGWTEGNLALRNDGLLAWRWRPDTVPNVPDMNNASDGDIFYAWALMKGADQFDMPDCRGRAATIVAGIVRACLPPVPAFSGQRLLLPGADGFVRTDGTIYNPSYWMPQLMSELAMFFGAPGLQRAVDDGLARLSELAATGLAPDWMLATPQGWAAPPAGFSANAGYEAMRVPLYLCLSGLSAHPMVARFHDAYVTTGTQGVGTATVFDVQTGAALERSPDMGYAALAGLTACGAAQDAALSIPLFTTDQPYYPATLHLFVLIAQLQRFPQCQPI
ncbi:glycosyl hydrolase family 8 [Falsirhodobacter deserti]|uniref:glycosyl hydrolase family 8 n=1 Tax=Falsirhodobacter deserti TaxID=1365611 RepID=UPI000FE442EC|nr:glycosyl hydrolase family 8 [Falsirhodobacter deserti]